MMLYHRSNADHAAYCGPRRILPGLAVLALLAGCSVNTYKPAVERFAAATNQARDAYTQMETTVLSAHTESLRRRVLRGDLLLDLADNSCRVQDAACFETVLDPRTRQTEPLHARFDTLNALLRGIAEYAKNLNGIVASDAPQQVTAHLAAASGSIKSLAGTIAKAKGGAPDSSATAFIEPSANLAAWLAGEFINHLRVNALRKATDDANQRIQEAAVILTASANVATASAKAASVLQLRAARQAHTKAPADPATLRRLESAVRELDELLKATAPETFKDLADAHQALTDALAGRNVSLADAYAAIEQFATKAESLHKMIAAIAAAGATTTAKK